MTQLSSSLLPTDDTGNLTSGTALSRAYFSDWRDGINTLIHSATNPTITPADIIDEVVTARDGQASLDARLDAIVALIGASGDAVDTPATYGENVSAGNAIYLSSGSGGGTAGRWYKADNANAYSSATAKALGFAPTAVLAGASDFARISGLITGLAGLTAGTVYYASNTPGGLTSVAPTNAAIMGVAVSTTTLLITSATRIQALQALLDAAKGSAADLDARLDQALQASGLILSPYTATLKHTAGTGTGTGPAPVRFSVDSTTTGNVGAGEDTLQSITLPANSLDEDGDTAFFQYWGSVANNANNKTLKFKFGTDVVTITSANGFQNYTWRIDATVVRLSATTQRIYVEFFGSAANTGIAGTMYFNSAVSGTQTLANAITVLLTGEASSDNDIVKTLAKAKVE